MKRVLVTGASGFIGRHTLEDLVGRGFEVHAAGRTGPPPEVPPAVRFHSCDLLDGGSTTEVVHGLRPTHLLHLAWYAKPRLFWGSIENLRWLAASLNLYLAFAESGGARAVMAGTCAEYDWRHTELDERTTPLAPRTLYGQCKRALHDVLDNACRQTGVGLAWGRIFFVYGPHEPPERLVSDVASALVAGEEARCSEGLQERDYMHVHDVGRAFAALVDSDVTGAVNIASGECVSIRSLVETLGKLTGQSRLVRFGAVHPRADDPPRLAARVDILRDRVGFRPEFDLASGLADTVRWWRAREARGR